MPRPGAVHSTGAKDQNFHKNVFERVGHAELTDQVQELFWPGSGTRQPA